jgi:hypothetical protein
VLRRSSDISTLVEDLRVLHVTVAQPIWHLELNQDVDCSDETNVGCACITQSLFKVTQVPVGLHQNDSLAQGFTGMGLRRVAWLQGIRIRPQE